MADPRSVMQEFRFLEQRRQAGSLTPAEAARHAELRDLVGVERPAPARGGFDVAAAAAQLRESLLPAGLRQRPVDSPAPPPAPLPPPAPAPAPPAAPAPERLFDPASLGQEVRPQAWNPEAPGYDPDAPYDEAAWIAAGYDPSVTYDWSGSGAADPTAPAAETAGDAAAPQFGEYDAPGGPVATGEPLEATAPPPPPAPDGDAGWLDGSGAPLPVAPLANPAFGEYDAPAALGEAAGALELGEPPTGWLSDETPDGGFLAASGGSFGEAADPPQASWSAAEPPAAESAADAERWESAPALDLSTPFEPVLVPAARPPEPATPDPGEVIGELEPEELLEPLPELPEPAAEGAPPSDPLDPLPAENPWPPPPLDLDAGASPPPLDLGTPLPPPAEVAGEPLPLADLDPTFEIDVPPEIAAAYDAAPPPTERLAFGAPPPSPQAPPVPEVAAEDVEVLPATDTPAVPAPPPPPGRITRVLGEHRVVVHTLDGAVLRGTLTDVDLEAPELALDTGAPGQASRVASAGVKAIFFMLAPGQQPPAAVGQRVRVAFRDGRQVAGFSPDYREGGAGFFMIPVDTRTNTGRIWVYQAAVRQVTIS